MSRRCRCHPEAYCPARLSWVDILVWIPSLTLFAVLVGFGWVVL